MGHRHSAGASASRCSADVLGGRYRLGGLLGSGGTAHVYRGFDLRLKRSVAIKVFRPDSGFQVEGNSHGEAVVLARLNHPRLVTAFDAGQHEDRPFLVMQLIEGTTLKHRIAKGPLSVAETAALGADVAEALTHAHGANIVHRDVKPSNILIDPTARPYLTDFGISRLLDTTTRTATGALIGTAAYLSPEQVLGQPVGRPADVYALGLVLLECLTGHLEYDGTPLEAAIARLHRQPTMPDDLPRRLSDVLGAMTAMDEKERPTALDCAHLLAKAVEEAPTAARPSSHAVVTAREPEQEPRADEPTHRTPLRSDVRLAAPAQTGRRRPRAVGAGIALVAISAVTLAVSANLTAHSGDPSGAKPTSVPSTAPERDGTAAPRKTPISGDDADHRRDATARRSPSAPAGLSQPPGDETASARTTPGPAGAPAPAARDRSAATKSLTPPGQARKAAKCRTAIARPC
ncbi:protein kinase [Streptomyces sp. NPDC052225]|uniref:serine/threonine-protein kinase n=1 Tax=Streptomyces sp. NPDC052225 TaxID=3154949 RepID=UPI00342AF342